MTKQTILQKALELFMQKGYEGASMNDIAVATGIRKASLYAHFDGKESIFAAIFEDILSEYVHMVGEMTAARENESAAQRLERIFIGFIDFCFENPMMYFWDRYFYFPPAFIAQRMQQKTQETQELFLTGIQACVEEGIRAGLLRAQPAADAALTFYYLMIGLSMSVKLYDAATLKRDVRAAWAGLARGLLMNAD